MGLLIGDKEEIIKEEKYKPFYMHKTGHWLGLDVHDAGLYRAFEPNMVITVEPGIYLPDEGFGVRVEDDVVIQDQGAPFNLMRDIPITVDEIETLMHQ